MTTDFTFTELTQAYFDCRRTKRNSASALAFEERLESNLRQLHDELAAGTYIPGRSICFVITWPKPREVWAADFRDRIVHHLLHNHVAPRFYARFIADSCACIPGRGTLRASQRAANTPARQPKANPDNVRLKAMPWKVADVFRPLETIIRQIEREGTVEACQGRPVFREESRGGWYEFVPALKGVIDFHQLAAERKGITIDCTQLTKFAKKLDAGMPLTLGEAKANLRDVRIKFEMEKMKEAA